jgi:hypothetical protein
LTCDDGEILEFESSTGLWECGTDSSGASEGWVETNYVPYIGATSDVDLGVYNLNATDGDFSGDLTVGGEALFNSNVEIEETLNLKFGMNFETIPKPTSQVTVTLLNVVGNIDIGRHRYFVTYYSPAGETEVKTGAIPEVTTDSTHGQVAITNIPISPDSRVTGRRIYRTTLSSIYNAQLLVDIPNNIDTTTANDNVADVDLIYSGASPGAWYYPDTTSNFITVNGETAMSLNNKNTIFGYGSGGDMENWASYNSFFGAGAGESVTDGSYNTFIGNTAGGSNSVGVGNTLVGRDAGRYIKQNFNTMVGIGVGGSNSAYSAYLGSYAGYRSSGDYNVFLGNNAGYYSSGNKNIVIGGYAKRYSTGNNNIIIGYNVAASQTEINNQLWLDYGDNPTPLIWGDFSTDEVKLRGDLEVANDLTVGGDTFFKDKIFFTQTDGNEFIDSLNDGYLDYSATSGHRFNANITSEEFILGKNQVTQLHNDNTVVQTSADTWKNISWNLMIDDKTTAGYTVTDDNESVQFDFDGIVRVQGCLHPYNNNAGNSEAKILVRTLIDGVEARCLQASKTKAFKSSGVDILEYIGTIAVEDGMKVQIQWRVDNTDIELRGDTDFDNPVSASLNLERISN